ncbi:MAG: bifunctional 4-hydroxy-2-oxoglutarate aldolase/2-dehydro-3-deoxy-phosphogluconate aldolase [Pseudomonadota bacterium]
MTPKAASQETLALCKLAPVIPVLVIEDPEQALPLARALISGGLPVLEVTLRTPAAFAAIAEMALADGGIVGAGTVLTPDDVVAAKDAGARFAVSPGATAKLLEACEDADLPLLPGAATASEAMALFERGYSTQKFFPAEVSGGAAALKAFASPLPKIAFCPTGGIDLARAADYLKLPNCHCVGGSWVAPPDAVADGDWPRIEDLAREAAKLQEG